MEGVGPGGRRRNDRTKGIPIVVLGCGGVGRQLIQHVVNARSLHAKQGLHLRVLGVSDSRTLITTSDISQKCLDDKLLDEIYRAKSRGSSLEAVKDLGEFQVFKDSDAKIKLARIINNLGKSTGVVLVDCSASQDTVQLLIDGVSAGCCVVLANKKPLSSSLEQYEVLTSCMRYIRYESTVGAGLPVITSLMRIIASGDLVHRIVGSLSGTLGYVMSELEDGKLFSQVVQAARVLGYTEPDPRDDLGGMDVARKALILGRLLGEKLYLEDIKVESLYPEEMGPSHMSVEDFMGKGLPSLDKDMADRVEMALLKGNALRYVCIVEGSRCHVGLKQLPRNSALGQLRGSDNVVEINSRCYNDLPLVIQGAGAGNDATAAGVLADIIDLQDLFP